MESGAEYNMLTRARSVIPPAGLALTLLLGGCGQPTSVDAGPGEGAVMGSSAEVDARCSLTAMALAKQYGRVDSISGSFPSSIAGVREYQTNRNGPDGPSPVSPLPDHAADEAVALCYFDGDFNRIAKGPPLGADGSTPSPVKYTRLGILVFQDGSAVLEGFGSNSGAPPTGPSPASPS